MASLPAWDMRGIGCCLALHVGLAEPVYYLMHRALHSRTLFDRYHWIHHSSTVPHPFTGRQPNHKKMALSVLLLQQLSVIYFSLLLYGAAGHLSFFEHLLLCVVVGIPTLGTTLLGFGSVTLMYGYLLSFDFLRCLGHCNVEVVPYRLFKIVPLLKYLIYTPTWVV